MKTLTCLALWCALALSISLAVADEAKVWDGFCRNVTYQADGTIRLFTIRDGEDLSGSISIAGWLTGSGEIRGKWSGNKLSFVSKDILGGQIRWEGLIRDGQLVGEYYIDSNPQASLPKQVGEFQAKLVHTLAKGVADSEASFKEVFKFMLELNLNAPVTLHDGSRDFGANAVFQAVHPGGTGVSIRVDDVEIDWMEGATKSRIDEIWKYRAAYTIFWYGLANPGQTRMYLAYNSKLGVITDHAVIESTGITNQDIGDLAFEAGKLLGQAAFESFFGRN